MKNRFALMFVGLLFGMIGLTSCNGDMEFDYSVPPNPVISPIKSLTAVDGKKIAVAEINNTTHEISLALNYASSLSEVEVSMSIARRAALVSPLDTVLTLDLTKPYEIIVNTIDKDVTYTLTAKLAEFHLVDYTDLSSYPLDNDAPGFTDSNINIDYLWDNKWMSKPDAYGEVSYHNYQFGGQGNKDCAVTFDAGSPLFLSRFRTMPYWNFTNVQPYQYELWAYAKDGEPSKSGNWGEWTRIAEITSQKNFTEGDNTYIDKDKSVKARYYRIRCLKNYNALNGTGVREDSYSFSEITLWTYNKR